MFLKKFTLLILLASAVLFFSGCESSSKQTTIPGTFKQLSEIRVQEDGTINISNSFDIEIKEANSMRGLGIALPKQYESLNNKFNLNYQLVFAMINGEKVPHVFQTKDAFNLLYLGNLAEYLPVGKHNISFQLIVSGYNLAQKGFKEFSWYPVRNFNTALSSLVIKLYPPKSSPIQSGKYFALLWANDSEDPETYTPKLTEDSATLALSNIAAGSHIQVIARWPEPQNIPTKPAANPQLRALCADAGENYEWNVNTGKCELVE